MKMLIKRKKQIEEKEKPEEEKEKSSKEKGKSRKKSRIILWAAGVLIIAAGIAGFFFIKSKNIERQINMPPSMNTPEEGVVSASGLTAVGMLDETWELDFLQTALYVEDSYLSTGDEVEKGTAVFKVSDETLQEARKELENAVTEAELAYRQGVIDYEAGVIDARVANENAAVNKKYGQVQYDNAVSEAAQNVKDLEKQIEEAGELVDEYTKSVNEDYYRTYYKIDELYQTYYEHFGLLMETYEKWDIENKESLYGNSVPSLGDGSGSSSGSSLMGSASGNSSAGSGSMGNSSGSGSQMEKSSGGEAFLNTSLSDSNSAYGVMNLVLAEEKTPGIEENIPETEKKVPEAEEKSPAAGDSDATPKDNEDKMPEGFGQQGAPDGAKSGDAMGGGYSESETLLSVYNLLDEMVKQEGEEYETALKKYETARKTAQAGLEKAQSNLASLKAELVTARTEYEKQLITCQSDYEITLAESDNAQAVYEVTLESLKETLNSLENEKEEAAENLALFEEVIGDGYFYTQSAGTIVLNGVRKGDYLSGESLIIAYSNPENVSVSANVDQSDIAEIAIGDSVYVVISKYGNYQGKVTMINPVTQGQSRTSVTYQVTVTLEGGVSALDSNLTAYVYFGMSDENIQEMQNMPQDGDSFEEKGKNAPERGNIPGNGSGLEDTKGAPGADGRPQTEENSWQEKMAEERDNAFPENERKEDGQ